MGHSRQLQTRGLQRRLKSERHGAFLPWGNKEGERANPTDFIRFLIYWPLRRLCWGLSFWWDCLAVKVKHAKKHEMIFSKKDCISLPGKWRSNSPQKGAFQELFVSRVSSPKCQRHSSLQPPLCGAGFICCSWGKMGRVMKERIEKCIHVFLFTFLLSQSVAISDTIYQ